MVRAPTDYDEVAAFLYRDPFANANMIGAVERRVPELADVWISTPDDEGVQGVMVVDAGVMGERAIGIDAVTPTAASELLETLPAGEALSFGLHRPLVVEVIRQKLRPREGAVMGGFRCDAVSFLAAGSGFGRELSAEDHGVVRRCRDDHFQSSFHDAVQGRRTAEGLEVRTFGVIAGTRLVARCLTTWGGQGIDRLLGTVWSVYTEPSCRNRGLGRAVVSAATAAILASGRTARYFAYNDNEASIRICERLGYRHDHEIHYFQAKR